jgi:argininosuccinate lyase
MRKALTMDVLATDLADYLVRKGVSNDACLITEDSLTSEFSQIPFRETHHISGRAVALAESRGVQLNELTFEDYRQLSDKFEEDIFDVFSFEASVERRNAIGGTSKEMVERQIGVLRNVLNN